MSCRLPEKHKESLPVPLADVLVIGRSLYGVTGRLEEEMAAVFGAASTTEEVLSGVNLRDKRILVTGVPVGLGVETARSLAAHGAQVAQPNLSDERSSECQNLIDTDGAGYR